ncbi:uncharacterized protein LOC124444810 [Xenia sp. Carnegie-2017]|uniref:uncharacterized protein LOC124444810 n=1 Tax=Xenia sp. Carnegie-2017 TaxID=2897299 RepID=UPI001F0464BF|nr:uncharacterized protein LOC124444810 [Xenia sp. Carnegie-2017]
MTKSGNIFLFSLLIVLLCYDSFGRLSTRRLPFCKSRDVTAILRATSLRRTKRAVNWPFDCTHASILEVAGRNQFVFPIYDCCRKCEFPTFQLCTTRNRYSPSWLCPSKGMQCIVKCINFNNPYIISKVVPKRKKVPTRSRVRLIPSIRRKKLPVSQKCQRVVRKRVELASKDCAFL